MSNDVWLPSDGDAVDRETIHSDDISYTCMICMHLEREEPFHFERQLIEFNVNTKLNFEKRLFPESMNVTSMLPYRGPGK